MALLHSTKKHFSSAKMEQLEGLPTIVGGYDTDAKTQVSVL
jgi:hypothetical protein